MLTNGRRYSLFGDDPGQRRRFAVAIPIAIVVSVLAFGIAGLKPVPMPLPPTVVAATVRLERIVTPAPTLISTPAPPPPRPAASRTMTPFVQPASPPMYALSGGQHAAKKPNAARRLAIPIPSARRASDGTNSSSANGVGAGNGAKLLGDGIGPASGSGAGSGASSGSGAGLADPGEPCGEVDFIQYDRPTFRGGATYEKIRATVRFPDGHLETADFPYPWVYTSDADDPWSQRNIANPHFVTRAQLPTPSTNEGPYSSVIRYILDHTRADGTTVLQDCS